MQQCYQQFIYQLNPIPLQVDSPPNFLSQLNNSKSTSPLSFPSFVIIQYQFFINPKNKNQNKMQQQLPRNGSFPQRRKVFIQLPFHHFNHNHSLGWNGEDRSTQEQQRRQIREIIEHQRMKREYQRRIQYKLRQKYANKVNTSRVIPNEITRRQDQEVLAKQIQQFNNSKIINNSNPEQQEFQDSPLRSRYRSAAQINQKDRPDSQYRMSGLKNAEESEKGRIQEYRQSREEGQGYKEKYKKYQSVDQKYKRVSPEPGVQDISQGQSPQSQIYAYQPSKYGTGLNSLPLYRKYANLANSTPLGHVGPHHMRNYLPDQLEGFLREKAKIQRRRPLPVSPSLNRSNHV